MRKKLKKCKEKTAEKVQNFAGEVQAREKASWRRWEVQFQGATGLPRAASAAPNPGMPYLRRKREAKWPDSEKLLGNFWPLSRNDFLKLRRQPGKKQVGAAGKFNSEVPQACLGAAAAAPNPGISILRRKREAKWPDSEKLLVFIKECFSEIAAPAREKASWRRREVQTQGATGLPRRRISGPKLAVYLLHADSA